MLLRGLGTDPQSRAQRRFGAHGFINAIREQRLRANPAVGKSPEERELSRFNLEYTTQEPCRIRLRGTDGDGTRSASQRQHLRLSGRCRDAAHHVDRVLGWRW